MKNLSIVTMAQNEGNNLKEWIDFHVRQGVDYFVVYDHLSTDNTRQVLDQFPPSLVRVIPLTVKEPHAARIHMAREMIRESKRYAHFVAFIDVDEFLFSPDPGVNALDIIRSIFSSDTTIGGIGLNWLTFGTCCEKLGQELKLKSSSIVKNCTFRADKGHSINHHIKTVFRPNTVADRYTDPHGLHYKPGFRCTDTNGKTIEGPFNRDPDFPTDKLRLHHYFISSIRFFLDEKLDRLSYIHKNKPFPEVLENQARLMRELRNTKDTSASDFDKKTLG